MLHRRLGTPFKLLLIPAVGAFFQELASQSCRAGPWFQEVIAKLSKHNSAFCPCLQGIWSTLRHSWHQQAEWCLALPHPAQGPDTLIQMVHAHCLGLLVAEGCRTWGRLIPRRISIRIDTRKNEKSVGRYVILAFQNDFTLLKQASSLAGVLLRSLRPPALVELL